MAYTSPMQYGGATYTGTRWTTAPPDATATSGAQQPYPYYQSGGQTTGTPTVSQGAPLPDYTGTGDPWQWGASQVPSYEQQNAYWKQQQQNQQQTLAQQLAQQNQRSQAYNDAIQQRQQQLAQARQYAAANGNASPSGGGTVPAAPGTAAYGQPITAGIVAPPGAVQTNLGTASAQGVPLTAAQAMSLMSQGRNVLNQQDAANTVALGRSASVDLANLMNQRQAAIQNQGIGYSQLAAGQYGNLLNNALANQQLNSQLWQGNVGLQNMALGQANYLAPLLTQLFG